MAYSNKGFSKPIPQADPAPLNKHYNKHMVIKQQQQPHTPVYRNEKHYCRAEFFLQPSR